MSMLILMESGRTKAPINTPNKVIRNKKRKSGTLLFCFKKKKISVFSNKLIDPEKIESFHKTMLIVSEKNIVIEDI